MSVRMSSTVLLGEVSEILSGFAFKSSGFNVECRGFPIVRIRDVVRGYTDTYYEGYYDKAFIVRNGDILIGMDGEFNRERWGSREALLNQRVCKIRGKSKHLYDGYLYHLLPQTLKEIEDRTPFVTVKHLSAKELRSVQLFLPPLDEQKWIAAILDKADALRRQRRQALALLDSLTQSIFLEMFGDPVSNPKGWPIGRVGDLIESASYGTSAKAASAGAFPILRMGNITSTGLIDISDLKYIDLDRRDIEKYTVRKGDIVFNRTNSADLVGKTALFDADQVYAFAGYLVRIRVGGRSSPEYVSCYLNSKYGKKILRGMAKSIVGMANINAREMQNIQIPIPPIDLQLSFSKRLEHVKCLRPSYLSPLAELDSLFASLQHRAFSGQL